MLNDNILFLRGIISRTKRSVRATIRKMLLDDIKLGLDFFFFYFKKKLKSELEERHLG